jgi:hypothetical protein
MDTVGSTNNTDYPIHKHATVDRKKWDKQMRTVRISLSIGFGVFSAMGTFSLSTSIGIPILSLIISPIVGIAVGRWVNRFGLKHINDAAFEHQLRFGPPDHPEKSYVELNRDNPTSVHCDWGFVSPASPNCTHNKIYDHHR